MYKLLFEIFLVIHVLGYWLTPSVRHPWSSTSSGLVMLWALLPLLPLAQEQRLPSQPLASLRQQQSVAASLLSPRLLN